MRARTLQIPGLPAPLQAFLRDEGGQSTVETMLVVSVLTIASVVAGYVFVESEGGFQTLMSRWDAATVYAQEPTTP